jgi:K+-transporting ATPase c subunit
VGGVALRNGCFVVHSVLQNASGSTLVNGHMSGSKTLGQSRAKFFFAPRAEKMSNR